MQRKILLEIKQGANRQGSAGKPGPVIVKTWKRLTEQDVEEVSGRGALARKLAQRYDVPVREAKRQVRDFLRVAAARKSIGGKRGRSAVARMEAGLDGDPIVKIKR